MAPAFFIGLIWRNGTSRGAIAGMGAGFLIWAYTLVLPWIAQDGVAGSRLLTDGPFGLTFLAPQALFYLRTRMMDKCCKHIKVI